MKKTLLMMTAAAFSLGAAEYDKVLDNSFTLTGDFAYFLREDGSQHKVVIDKSNDARCSTKTLVKKFDFEPGFKVAATYLTDHSVWDLSYLWLQEWKSDCSRSNPRTIDFSERTSALSSDFNNADHGSVDYHSQFQNAELNYYRYAYSRHEDYFSAAYLLGVRYMNLKESLDIGFIKRSSKSSYKIHTSNHIPAVQVGGLVAWNPTKKITWDVIGMAGVGFDMGEQKTFVGDENNTVAVRHYEESGFSTPLVVEGLIRLGYQPAAFVNLHIAYQFIYLNGVALAPDQIVKSASHKHVYRAIGYPLFHGLTAGIAWSF